MGSKKRGLLEKIKEGSDVGAEAIAAGEKLEGDGTEIKALLDGIDTSLDDDDLSAVQDAETSYGGDFNNAFREDVESKSVEMKSIESDAISESGVELDKVEDAADKFREMASVTDVGRGNADAGADQMKSSAREYEDYINQANDIIQDTESEVSSLENAISDIFG